MERNIFRKEWEALLIKKCLEHDTQKKNVYICSPLRANTIDEIYENMKNAQKYMFYVQSAYDVAAYAPHAYLPILLNDNSREEREMALKFGLNILKKCQELFVCSNYLTEGMIGEIYYAAANNIKICVFDERMYMEVSNILGKNIKANLVLKYDFILRNLNTKENNGTINNVR